MKGILILSLGHSNYGRMALNLALSIRHFDKRVPIHLVYTDSAITGIKNNMQYFSSTSVCPKDYYNYKGETAFIKAKVHIYDLTPFESTLFLDADTIWLPNKKATDVIDELAGNFVIANRGFFDFESSPVDHSFSQWINMEEIRAAYGFKAGRYYSLHSEFVYFEKNEVNQKYFETVKAVYENPKAKPVTFAGAIPDEVAFSLASILCNHYPHKDNYIPVFWQVKEKRNIYDRIHQDYYMLSIGGKVLDDGTIHEYDRLALAYASKENIQPFMSRKNAKMNWLPERRLL